MTTLRAEEERHERRAKIALVVAGVAAISAVHFLLGMESSAAQAVHVVFGALYLVPVLTAAVWFGWRAGVLCAVITAGIYWVHVVGSWPAFLLVDVTQATMMSVFVVVAAVTGVLVERRQQERARRIDSERRAERAVSVGTLSVLVSTLAARDEETLSHGERVSRVASAVGLKLGLEPERLDLLRLAALVHDVGWTGKRADVLLDRDRLSLEERGELERHPLAAAAMLRGLRGMDEVAEIVLSHHECPDGSGYPRQLRAEAISPEASALRVADVFAAFTDGLGSAGNLTIALGRMQEMAGTKLDARALQALVRVVDGWTHRTEPARVHA